MKFLKKLKELKISKISKRRLFIGISVYTLISLIDIFCIYILNFHINTVKDYNEIKTVPSIFLCLFPIAVPIIMYFIARYTGKYSNDMDVIKSYYLWFPLILLLARVIMMVTRIEYQ